MPLSSAEEQLEFVIQPVGGASKLSSSGLAISINPRDHLQASYNLDSELKPEYAGRNHSNINEFPKIAEISLKNAKISKIIGNC